jgi:hypothetical protein
MRNDTVAGIGHHVVEDDLEAIDGDLFTLLDRVSDWHVTVRSE